MIEQRELSIRTNGQGLYLITFDVSAVVESTRIKTGLCVLFLRHTSAGLLIQEAADPSAKRDLETWFRRLVPPDDPLYTHNSEGPDDMPSHIKAALIPTSLSIPITAGKLALGRWQGIYLWEHRDAPHTRTLVVHVFGERT